MKQMPAMRKRIASPGLLVGAALWAASLALYLSTLAPTLTWGEGNIGVDGGELLAAAKTLGVPHPPGYPTYTLLLRGFATLVPIGDFAYRGNLMSAVLASLSVELLYVVTMRFARHLWPQGPPRMWILGAALLQFDWYWESIRRQFPDRVPAERPEDFAESLRSIVEHNAGDSRVFFTYREGLISDSHNLTLVGRLFEARPKGN